MSLISTYVSLVVVHVEYAAFFMHHFKRLDLSLGAVLNQEEARVMTPTNGLKLMDLLIELKFPHLCSTEEGLLHMITQNSTKGGWRAT